MNSNLLLTVFALIYLAMAIGRIPGLRTDRAGLALVAAALMMVITGAKLEQTLAWVDLPTLALLFGLMVLSAQFGISGFYDYCTDRITHAAGSPQRLLAATIVIAAGLSAVLANDIIAFAVPPLLCLGLSARRLDPVPFLIGQVGGLDFWRFLAICGVPSLLGLIVAHAVICWQWRGRWRLADGASTMADRRSTPLQRRPLLKAVAVTAVLLIAFGIGAPRDLAALLAAAALFMSRRVETRAMVGAVDWSLLILFGGLFIVTGVVAELPETRELFDRFADAGLLPDRLAVLAPLTLVMSNTIGNVPSVILLLQVWSDPSPEALYALALLSTLAGNLLLTGSLANLIVAERAASVGARLPFLAHARAGVPITLLTFAIAGLWLWAVGVVPL